MRLLVCERWAQRYSARHRSASGSTHGPNHKRDAPAASASHRPRASAMGMPCLATCKHRAPTAGARTSAARTRQARPNHHPARTRCQKRAASSLLRAANALVQVGTGHAATRGLLVWILGRRSRLYTRRSSRPWHSADHRPVLRLVLRRFMARGLAVQYHGGPLDANPI